MSQTIRNIKKPDFGKMALPHAFAQDASYTSQLLITDIYYYDCLLKQIHIFIMSINICIVYILRVELTKNMGDLIPLSVLTG